MPCQHSCFKYGTWRTKRQWIGKNLNEIASSCKKPCLGTQSLPISPVSLHPMQQCVTKLQRYLASKYLKVCTGSVINTVNSGGGPSPTLHPPLCESGQCVPRYPRACPRLVMMTTKFYARTTKEINLQLQTITKCSIGLYFGKQRLHRIRKPNILHCHRKCPMDCFLFS